jgi:hypothetical protein
LFFTLKDAKHYAYVAPTVYHCVALWATNCICPLGPIDIAEGPLIPSMAAVDAGYTFNVFDADVFLMYIHKPATAVISLTPLLLLGVVTVNISAPVNAVAEP